MLFPNRAADSFKIAATESVEEADVPVASISSLMCRSQPVCGELTLALGLGFTKRRCVPAGHCISWQVFDVSFESRPVAEDTSLDPMMAAIRAFTSRGYDATTVDDIADAAEISRSTFFRRFKSKDDVVFADHEILLRRVDEYLETTSAAPLQAVC